MDKENNRFWIWATVLMVVLVLVLAGTAWFGRGAYRHYKQTRDVLRAQAFLDRQDYRNAQLCARQVLLLNPSNVAACRIMAQLADLSHVPAALDWAQRVVEIEPSVTNKILLALVGLRYQNYPFPLTTQMLDELAPVATNLPTYQIVSAELALRTRQLADAEAHLEAALQLDPTNQLYAMNLAVVRLSSTNTATLAASRAVLEQFRTEPALAAPALRSLMADAVAHQALAAAAGYATQLLASPQAVLSDRLQYLGILRQQQSAELEPQLRAVQEQSATNAAAVAEVADWMQGNDRGPAAITWLTSLPADLQNQAPVRLALANALLAGGDWQQLREDTAQGNWGEIEFLRLAFLSRAWGQLGEGVVAGSTWRTAVNEAGKRFGALTMLLGLAERWEMRPEREKLLEKIVALNPRERWAAQELAEWYEANGDTAGLNRLFTRLSTAFPDDLIYKNNLAATSLLLKTNLPQAYQWAAEVYTRGTNDPVIASTYAFALYLQGRTREGVAVMQKLDERSLRQPSSALYYGVLLAASGATNEASGFLKIAEKAGHMLPEEDRLLLEAGK